MPPKSYNSCDVAPRSEPRSELGLRFIPAASSPLPRLLSELANLRVPGALKRKTYARPSEGAEGANALGLKGAKPVPRDIFGFVKTGPRAIARGRGGD